MESTIVIKVKYGETLRRFNALVVGKEFSLHMNELREKIISLFSFPFDSELTLTYIDEDGDVVTLADEEDLRDIVRQSLDPLRISVRLNTEGSTRSHGISSGNSTPVRSPRVPTSSNDTVPGVSNAASSLPEYPYRPQVGYTEFLEKNLKDVENLKKLSRHSTELVSNTTSFPQGYAEILDSLSKTYLKEAFDTKGGPSGITTDPPVTKEEINSKVDGNTHGTKSESKGKDGVWTGFSDSLVIPVADMVDLNAAPHDDKLPVRATTKPSPFSFGFVGDKRKDANSSSDYKMKEVKASNESRMGWKSAGFGPKSMRSVSGTKDAAVDYGNSSGSVPGVDYFGECPYSGMPMDNFSSFGPGRLYFPPPLVPSFKRIYNNNDDIGSIFHMGVCCDGCGVHPITGPRFKSKVKEDYDLCSICFGNMGNNTDYIRMDRPSSHRHPLSLKGYHNDQPYSRRHPTHPKVMKGSFPAGLRGSASRCKLDSRFIQDVSILDGTIMAPSTSFTKIWRMRNSGNVTWPRGSQLLWIGGDRFSKTLTAELEIPAEGCLVDTEIDIAVDFNAPQHPGRYVSYWRMASPSGQKFGQRVWVLIQVDASMNDMSGENMHGFNLNLPPTAGIMGSQMENVNAEPMEEDSPPNIGSAKGKTELVEPAVEAPANKDQELNFPINDTLLVGGAMSNPVHLEGSSPVEHPPLSLSEVAAPIATTSVQTSKGDDGSKDEVEQTLLKELEEMGFERVDLNKEILRMNDYDLEQSVDDLCGVAEWDPILEELNEMGFSDQKMNKMLLKKNNGSIKRVVMDLIAGEKPHQS